jgi:hypothetical protein
MPDPALSEPLELSHWRQFAELHDVVSTHDSSSSPKSGGKLIPRMPVGSFFQTGNRTILSYLTKPLSDPLIQALGGNKCQLSQAEELRRHYRRCSGANFPLSGPIGPPSSCNGATLEAAKRQFIGPARVT